MALKIVWTFFSFFFFQNTAFQLSSICTVHACVCAFNKERKKERKGEHARLCNVSHEKQGENSGIPFHEDDF